MKAVITVIGKDTVGIIAKLCGVCFDMNANVTDVTQSVIDNLFAMVMMIDIKNVNCSFSEFSDSIKEMGKKYNLQVHVMHEDIFNQVNRI